MCGQHSFSIVKEKKFVELLQSLNPSIKIPCANSFKNLANKRYDNLKIIVKKDLIENKSQIALTTDIWTSINMIPYACITGYYISNNFELRNLLLNFEEIPHPHDSNAIFNVLKMTCIEYQIQNKIISVTTDNASNNVSGVKIFKNWLIENNGIKQVNDFHLRCFAHVINLAVNDGILSITDSIENFRLLVSFIKNSSTRTQILKEKCIEMNINYVKPKKDIKTRWNSTYDMLERALKLKSVFKALFDQNIDFNDFRISEKDWDLFQKLNNFLKIFYEATNILSGSLYSTICVNIPIYEMIIKHLENNEIDKSTIISERANKMLLKFKKNENEINNDLSKTCLLLDPRLKLDYFENENIKNTINNVFKNIYEMNYNKQSVVLTANYNETISNLRQSIFKRQKLNNETEEIKRYLVAANEDESVDPFNWWKLNQNSYPNLCLMAAYFLCIPSTSVPSEQVFSKAGELITKKRNTLSQNNIKISMLLNSWNKMYY
jgi:hypothetical protein